MKYFFTLTLVFLSTITKAQEPDWTRQLLEKTKGKKIIRWERPSREGNPWVALVTVKKKVGLYLVSIMDDMDNEGNDSSYVYNVRKPIQSQYDQIYPFKTIDKEDSDRVDYLQGQVVKVAEVRMKKKTGILVAYGDDYQVDYLDAKDFFQTIDWKNNQGTCVPVMKNDQWGVYDWYQQKYLFHCEYSSVEALPRTNDPNGFTSYSVEIFNAFNKRSQWGSIDMLDLDHNNGDGLFKARSKDNRKWGIFQYLGDEFIEAVPMKYDSIHHFPWNGRYTAVFNDGKVGFYLSYWSYDEYAKESIPCIYEDYKRFVTEDEIPKLAVKRDGKWGWVDWLTGEEKSEFTYETPDDLPYPFYQQQLWIDE